MEPDLKKQVPRAKLMKLLDELSAKRLIYIHAPAGYGKTVSALLWLAHAGAGGSVKNAWLALDEYDNKTSDFCRRLAAALLSLRPDNAAFHELAAHPAFDTAPAEFLIRALGFLTDDKQKYTLVLDDLHIIDNHEILKLLPVLLRRLPQSFTVMLLSRSAPPDSFADLMVKDALAIVDAGHLCFTSDEVKDFFDKSGQPVTIRQARDIYAATGGWAISLRALLLSGKENYDVKMTGQYLGTFLKTHVWERWDEKTRAFMTHTSVVEELTPDLCEALTGDKASAEILKRLTRENAFLRAVGDGSYRFHHLFREFLLNMLEQESEPLKKELFRRAGDWFYGRADYYKAVEYYIKCGNKNGITKGLGFMYDYNSPYAAIEDTLAIIHMSVDGSIVNEYPFLLEVQAWAAFIEGRGADMEGYLDRYYELLPEIVPQNPASAQTAMLLRCMDYRGSMVELTKSLKRLPLKLFAQANTPSISQNMPFFHRSSRDFSEYAPDMDKSLPLLRRTVGVLVGGEYEAIEAMIRAGLLYEQGRLPAAYEYALSANTALPEGCAPETRFCAMMILAAALNADGQAEDAHIVLANIGGMIEEHKAFYLTANLRAYLFRLKLAEGERDAAREWLKEYGEGPYHQLSFYKIFRHFTTARAHIVTEDYNTAILFLKKLLRLSEDYRRTLDIIETCVLLAIAYWKKGRGSQPIALEFLERAVITAHEYGYTQIFTNEGAELVSMLHRIYKRSVQKDYAGEIPDAFAKTLYISAVEGSKRHRGLTGGRMPEALKFTQQQKAVMRLMREGYGHRDIAEKMGLTPSGVKSHVKLIYKKLDVPGSVEAVMKIKELGILDE